ncbi:hypothetical protein NPIL_100861, partial [Nephila pilipes]
MLVRRLSKESTDADVDDAWASWTQGSGRLQARLLWT